MNCMKCGREIQDGIFCTECLEEMDRYPIKPGAVVQLPRRKPDPPVKKSHSRRKPQRSPEEQIKHLRRLCLRLMLALLVCLLLLIGSGVLAVKHLLENETVFLPGQNYSAVGSDPLDEWD